MSDSDIPNIKEKIAKRFRSIKNNDDPQKTITWKCKSFCAFGKSGICDQVWKEKNESDIEFVRAKYTIINQI